MNHTTECQAEYEQFKTDLQAYETAWPDYCRTCKATGDVGFEDDPSAEGVFLSSGSVYVLVLCTDCLEQHKCPRCHQETLSPETTCTHCGWTQKTGYCPHEPVCTCWDLAVPTDDPF